MIIRIDTLDHPGLAPYARLTEAQLRNRLRPDEALVIVESPKVIKTALASGCRPVSLLCEEKHIAGDAAEIIAAHQDIPVFTGPRDLLASLTGYTLTRGVLCAMRRPAEKSVEDVCRGATRIGEIGRAHV